MSDLRGLAALPVRDWALLAEAVSRLAVAAITVRFRPFEKGLSSSGFPLREGHAGVDTPRLAWAVRVAARRVPWRALCFEQGLALQAMLRQRGHDARLHYGVCDDADEGLTAHVWVTEGDQVLIGGEGHERFARLYSYP